MAVRFRSFGCTARGCSRPVGAGLAGGVPTVRDRVGWQDRHPRHSPFDAATGRSSALPCGRIDVSAVIEAGTDAAAGRTDPARPARLSWSRPGNRELPAVGHDRRHDVATMAEPLPCRTTGKGLA